MKNTSYKILFILCLAARIAHAQVPSYLPTNGLVAWYPFNGNANDESGNGNNGVAYNTQPTVDRFGNANSAFDFNGSTSYINCGSQFFNSVNYCSISMWLKTTNFSSVTKNLCNKRRETAGDGIGIMMFNSSVCGMLNREPQTYSSNLYSTCTPYSSTGWNHVVLVNNNSVLSIYLNGVLKDTKTLTVGPTVPGMPMYIGKGFDYDIGGGNRAFFGQLDDCAFYNRVLTTAEISALSCSLIPTFAQVGPYCSGASIPSLPTVSTNGITGSWTPAINNTNTTTYTFTPAAGQCASTTTLTITINPNITPSFNSVGPYCSGATIPALPTTSTNGINGNWSPVINNTVTTQYSFTPSGGQCANTSSLTITINPNVTPTFSPVGPYCIGSTIPNLPTISNNNISGVWSPSINNQTTTNYTFTPAAGLCAMTATYTIVINPLNTFFSTSPTITTCENTEMTTNVASTTGATGIGTVSGLPQGISATWANNTIILSGMPTASGNYNYTIPLTGGCGSLSASGLISVTATNTYSPPSSMPSVCLNSSIIPIEINTTGATGIGSPVNLPNGLSVSWNDNKILISGTATSYGNYSYSIPLAGGCGAVSATGNIIVFPPTNNLSTSATSIPYQAEIRSITGDLITDSEIDVRFTLHELTSNGAISYSESHPITTNELGLFSASIGDGTALEGCYHSIDWTQTNKFLQVEINQGSGWITLGNQKLLSVPFSIIAQKAMKFETQGLPVFENNTQALAGGLQAGELYRTSLGDLKVVY